MDRVAAFARGWQGIRPNTDFTGRDDRAPDGGEKAESELPRVKRLERDGACRLYGKA
jgi:hypothetical protein